MEYWNNGENETTAGYSSWLHLTQHCSRSLRSAQSRTASGIYDKRVPSFHHSSIPTFPQPLGDSPEFWILTSDLSRLVLSPRPRVVPLCLVPSA
jgi:hypothetical protein